MSELCSFLSAIATAAPGRIVLSKPVSGCEPYRKIVAERKAQGYHISRFTQTQAFHENIPPQELLAFLVSAMEGGWRQLNAWDSAQEHILMRSKRGEPAYITKPLSPTAPAPVQGAHNRQKRYLLPEGEVIPPLVDMGVFTKEGRVAAPMRDKFAQINRFLELVEDALREDGFAADAATQGKGPLRILDFGCGKSYLTFILYYYLTEVRKLPVEITGLDLKADVIEKCGAAAEKYGYTGLRFQQGDVAGYDSPAPADIVVTLHACDTATDYALFHAVRRGAKMILSVPCCQHELNGQMQSETLSLLTRYGIIQERFAALATDAIRGALLEYCGYKTQLLEFVDLAHTPKNLLIRGVKKRPAGSPHGLAALKEAQRLMEEFHLNPTLYRLMFPKGNTLI